MLEASEDSEHNVKELREFSHQPIKQQLKLMLLEKMKISTAQSPELNLKSFVLVCSKNAFHQLKKYSVTQISQKIRFMRWY